MWFGEAIVQSMIIFYTVYYAISDNPLTREGLNSDYWSISITQFTVIIVVVNIKIMIITKFWTKYFVTAVFIFSIAVYFLFIFFEDTQDWVFVYKTAIMVFKSPICIATMVFLCMLFFLLDYLQLTRNFNIKTS